MLEAIPLLILLLIPGPIHWFWWLLAILMLVPSVYAYHSGPPYVRSSASRMKTMLALVDIKEGERVYDLGCGDGGLLIAAAKSGADATGYELSLLAYMIAQIRVFDLRNAHVKFRDFWREDISDADVVFCYLVPSVMERFTKEIWPTLKPGTRVISNAFALPGIEPTKKEEKVYLYVK